MSRIIFLILGALLPIVGLAAGGEPLHFEKSTTIEYVATALFAIAVLHTFSVKYFNELAHKYRKGSVQERMFHFLGEVEAVFGMWAAVLIIFIVIASEMNNALAYMDQINYTEAAFVFVIMTMAATRPVIYLSGKIIGGIAGLLPFQERISFYMTTLIVGPILGSFITEPAAITVTALLLKEQFYDNTPRMSSKFMYATLGLLFVNISIGGTLTHFAAPPVLMVVGPWEWDMQFMLTNFGWKAAISVVLGTIATTFFFRKELKEGTLHVTRDSSEILKPSIFLIILHVVFMALTVAFHSHMSFFIPLFLFFIGLCTVTVDYQDSLKIKESLLVAFFLGGLVTLGNLQGWWIQPTLTALEPIVLFLGSTGLTAVTDNAAITFLGTQAFQGPDGFEAEKYMLVAGAVTGGGLTVIANAPNPAGFGILKDSFGQDGISPIGLLVGALPFTALASVFFLLFA